MAQLIEWLSQTSLSVSIQTNPWVVPTVQSIHIIAIGGVVSAVLMIDLRVLGWAGRDQSLTETVRRFGPWLTGGLCILLVTGILMVVGEPARELLSFSFWFKMSLIAIGTISVVAFRIALRKSEQNLESTLVSRWATKPLAILTLLIWAGIIVLGRLIAYDHLWGSWSQAPRA